MSKQIVISGNRVLAHGEDCFAVTNNTVVCTDSEKVYNNATIATVEEWPADIDTVGYEYHMGAFIPCAPFGTGKGNLAVLCPDDCKSLKDSGIHIDDLNNVLVVKVSSSYGEDDIDVYFDTDRTIRTVLVTWDSGFGVVTADSFVGFTSYYPSNSSYGAVDSGDGSISGNHVSFGCSSGKFHESISNASTFIAMAFLG